MSSLLLLFFFLCAASSEGIREEIRLVHGEEIVFQSPNYPEQAPAHLLKTWSIATDPGSKINIKCEDFRFFESVPCGDYAVVFNDGKVEEEICGVHWDFDYVSRGSSVEVTLRTGVWDSGFLSCVASTTGGNDSIDEEEDNETENQNESPSDSTELSEEVMIPQGESMELKSPNYPYDAPAKLLKTWTISTEPGFKINISCEDIRFPESTPCGQYAVVFDDGERIEEACGVRWDFNFISSGPDLKVTLRTGEWDWGFLSCRGDSIVDETVGNEDGWPASQGIYCVPSGCFRKIPKDQIKEEVITTEQSGNETTQPPVKTVGSS